MKRLSWIITLPLLIVAVALGLANSHPVVFNLWPLDLEFELPLVVFALAFTVFGVLLGGIGSFLAGGKTRSKLRQERSAKIQAERELQAAKQSKAGEANSNLPALPGSRGLATTPELPQKSGGDQSRAA